MVQIFMMLRGKDPAFDRMSALATDKVGLNEVIGRAAMNQVKDHLIAYNASHPNKLGGERTNFASKAAGATTFRADPTGATVVIAHVGIRLQYLGGTVYPGRSISHITGQPTKLLTIPAVPHAHGYRAAEWGELSVVWGKAKGESKPRPIALAAGNRTTRSGKDPFLLDILRKKKGGVKLTSAERIRLKMGMLGVPVLRARLTIIYWLVKQATIKPHRDILPRPSELMAQCRAAAKRYLARHQEG